jgi:DNA topoisomerase-1
MSGNLVIVESPAKAKTIERYLGPGYTVLASYGHVRDLPENPGKNQLGVDVDHDFTPVYEVVADRKKQLSAIQKAAAKADLVYLATDLDREGEAIAWHVAEAIHLAPDRTLRVTFSEITEAAIKRAFAEPRSIDRNLVDAQQARRVVDRLVGYTLSRAFGWTRAVGCGAHSRGPRARDSRIHRSRVLDAEGRSGCAQLGDLRGRPGTDRGQEAGGR